MHEYLSEDSDREISNETKGGGRTLVVFADNKRDVENSMVYAIVKNDDMMRVDVVFRGSSTRYDWKKNIKMILVSRVGFLVLAMCLQESVIDCNCVSTKTCIHAPLVLILFSKRKVKNPVKEQNVTLPMIDVHSGFAQILLGKGNTNGKQTMEEIMKSAPMGEILTNVISHMNNGYRYIVSSLHCVKTFRSSAYSKRHVSAVSFFPLFRLFVTGHSLGGRNSLEFFSSVSVEHFSLTDAFHTFFS
jgi:hypothetical protein